MGNGFIATFDVMPLPQPRARISRYGAYYPAPFVKYKNKLKQLMKEAVGMNQPLTGALKVHMSFYLPRPKSRKNAKHHVVRGDLSNYLKAVEDVANKIIWADDSQIVDMRCLKHYAPKSGPFIVLEVEEIL